MWGCAGAPDRVEAPPGDTLAGNSDCIFGGTVRDYQVLDEANLVVTGSGRRTYHVTLARRAFGLRSSLNLGFVSRSGRICAGFSEVVVDEAFGPEKIRIAAIRELTSEEHEDLLVRFGKKEPAVEQTPPPEPVESAEVEELD